MLQCLKANLKRILFSICLLPTICQAVTWSPYLDISIPGQDAVEASLGVNPDGNAVAVWIAQDGTNVTIQASTTTFGNLWSAPDDLSISPLNATGTRAAIDVFGNAIAIWTRSNGDNFIVQAARLPFGSSWEDPVDLSSTGSDAFAPQIAFDAQGNAVAVWEQSGNDGITIQSASLPFGGSWTTPVAITASGFSNIEPQLAIDPLGSAIVVWKNETLDTIQGSLMNFGGPWSTPANISSIGEAIGSPQIAIDATGNATAIWAGTDGANTIIRESDIALVVGTWSLPVSLSAPGFDAASPKLATDIAGNVMAVWQRSNGSNWIVQVTKKPLGRTWSTPLDLSLVGDDAVEPQIQIGQTGTAIVTWRKFNGFYDVIQATTKPCCGVWSDVATLSAIGQNASGPQVGVTDVSDAVILWTRSNGFNEIVQSSSGIVFPDLGICPN